MKDGAPKPHEVFRIFDRETGHVQEVYSRSYENEMDFASPEQARSAHCWGTHQDKSKFRIAKYRVTYELIDPDCDGSDMPAKSPDEMMDDLIRKTTEKFVEEIRRELMPTHEGEVNDG